LHRALGQHAVLTLPITSLANRSTGQLSHPRANVPTCQRVPCEGIAFAGRADQRPHTATPIAEMLSEFMALKRRGLSYPSQEGRLI
jgi:hypothetical protein